MNPIQLQINQVNALKDAEYITNDRHQLRLMEIQNELRDLATVLGRSSRVTQAYMDGCEKQRQLNIEKVRVTRLKFESSHEINRLKQQKSELIQALATEAASAPKTAPAPLAIAVAPAAPIASPDSVVTMTSLELVDFINSERGPGATELRHAHFMDKVPKVLGGEAAKFSVASQYHGGNWQTLTRTIYRFPKREACLMAMSYSYALQAKVFDRMTELEVGVNIIVNNLPALPTTFAQALRALADKTESEERLSLENGALKTEVEGSRHAVAFVDGFSDCTGSKCLREVAKLLNRKEREFIQKLISDGHIYRINKTLLPMESNRGLGRFTVTPGTSGDKAFTQVKVTPKGVVWLSKLYGEKPKVTMQQEMAY